MFSISSATVKPVSQENFSSLSLETSKNENKNKQIAKISLGVLSGLALLGIGYQAVKLYNQKDFKDDFINLVEKDPLSATYFAIDCIGKEDENSVRVAKEAFPRLIEKDVSYAGLVAEFCLRKTDKVSQQIVKEAFPRLLEKDPRVASLFAKACIGRPDENSQDVAKIAFSELLKRYAPAAANFAVACINKPDEISQKTMKNAFSELLQDHIESVDRVGLKKTPKLLSELIQEKRNQAVNFAEACMNDNSEACGDVVKNAYSELSKIDSVVGNTFAELCRDKTGEACQDVVNQAFSFWHRIF